jgi:hypothetical protein
LAGAGAHYLSSNPTEKHQVDIYTDLSKITAMHEESREPQNIIEDFVPSVISALVRPMFSREIAEFLGIAPVTVGNALNDPATRPKLDD